MGFNLNKDVVVCYRGVFERVPVFTTWCDIPYLVDNGIMECQRAHMTERVDVGWRCTVCGGGWECGGKSLREHPANGREDCSGALSVGECTIQ